MGGKSQRYSSSSATSLRNPPFPPEVPPSRRTGSAPTSRDPAPRLSSRDRGSTARGPTRGVRADVRACVRGGATCRAQPCREGEGAREEGGSRHLGASSRHNKAPSGSERIFFTWARGSAAGGGEDGPERRGGHGPEGAGGAVAAVWPGLAACGAPRERRGPAAPKARNRGGGRRAAGAAGPELGAGRRRRSPVARAAGPRAGAAPLFAGGGCRCGAAASGGSRRSVPRRESRRSAARVQSTRWAPCGYRWRGRFARGLAGTAPRRSRGGMGLGAARRKVVVRGPVSAGPFVKWWRFLASGAVIRCVWRGVVLCFGLRPFKA